MLPCTAYLEETNEQCILSVARYVCARENHPRLLYYNTSRLLAALHDDTCPFIDLQRIPEFRRPIS
jgi:hypothetical protein